MIRITAPSHIPHPLVPASAVTAAAVALYPGMLPRSAGLTTLVTSVFVAIATAAAVAASRHRRSMSARARLLSLAAAAGLLLLATAVHIAWQNTIRADLGNPPTSWDYGPMVMGATVVTFAAVCYLPRLTGAAVVLSTATLAGIILTPASSSASPTGAAPSATATAGPVVLSANGDLDQAVASVVGRWSRSPRIALSHTMFQPDRRPRPVVIAVPTGSGWIDQHATAAITERFGGEVDVLSVGYAATSSWRAFVTNRDAAGRSAIALLRAVIDQRGMRSPAQRPPIYLYGQSLGALGADQARAWAEIHAPGAVSGTLLAGVPADTVADQSRSPRRVIANASDPVAIWSPATVWRPAHRPPDTEIIGTPTHVAPWLPVISFLQTSIDLLAALNGHPGTGHRYGAEQGNLPGVAPTTAACLPAPVAAQRRVHCTGPRAASYAAPTR